MRRAFETADSKSKAGSMESGLDKACALRWRSALYLHPSLLEKHENHDITILCISVLSPNFDQPEHQNVKVEDPPVSVQSMSCDSGFYDGTRHKTCWAHKRKGFSKRRRVNHRSWFSPADMHLVLKTPSLPTLSLFRFFAPCLVPFVLHTHHTHSHIWYINVY